MIWGYHDFRKHSYEGLFGVPSAAMKFSIQVPVDPSKALEELLEGLREPGWKDDGTHPLFFVDKKRLP